jgi:hypothetical protein
MRRPTPRLAPSRRRIELDSIGILIEPTRLHTEAIDMHVRPTALAALIILGLGALSAHAQTNVLSYSEIAAEYAANPQAASKKYDGRRLAFSAQLMRMGSEPGGTYFGAIAEDGAMFDTAFEVADQEALKAKFEGNEIKPFQKSSTVVFECTNEGNVGTVVQGLKLGQCRVTK